MKKKFLLVLILFLNSRPAFSKGELDLPDIFVWGEDRSELPGVEKQDIFLSPYLRKYNYISPLNLADPDKIGPWAFPGYAGSSLRLTAGRGAYDEYLFSVAHSGRAARKWFWNANINSRREYLNELIQEYSETGGLLSLGLNAGVISGQVSGEYLQADYFREKSLWKTRTDLRFRKGIVSVSPFFSYSDADVSENKGDETEAGLSSEFIIHYNHRLTAYADYLKTDINGENTMSRVKAGYINSVFRDFTFLAEGGAAFGDSDNSIYRFLLSGDLYDTGYAIYTYRDYNNKNLFNLFRDYSFLQPNSVYNPERQTVTGAKLIKNFDKAGEVDLSAEYSVFKDKLVIIDFAEGSAPVNMKEEVKELTVKAGIEKDWVKAEYIYRSSDKKYPYLYNEFVLGASKELGILKGLRADAQLSHVSGHETWAAANAEGLQKVEPYLRFDAELSYRFGSGLELKAGGENLFSQEVSYPAGFRKEDPRYYAILSIGFSLDRNNRR